MRFHVNDDPRAIVILQIDLVVSSQCDVINEPSLSLLTITTSPSMPRWCTQMGYSNLLINCVKCFLVDQTVTQALEGRVRLGRELLPPFLVDRIFETLALDVDDLCQTG